MSAPSEVTCPPTTFYSIGKLMGPLKLTVGEIIGDFFYENSNKLKKEGIPEEYEFLYENFIVPEIGDLYDNEITNSILTAFANVISNKYNKDSAIACVDFLRRVFDWYGSKIKGFLNPVYGIKICDFEDKHRRMSQITLRQFFIEAYAKKFSNVPMYPYADIFKFIYLTGISFDELAMLEWESVDLSRRKIHIKECRDVTMKCNYRSIPLSSFQNREIFISDEVAKLLQKFKEKASTELVVSQENGSFFTETVLYSQFIQIMNAIGIADYYSLEVLRTTGMWQLFMLGNDTLLISRNYGINPYIREEYFPDLPELNNLEEIKILSE